MFMSTSQEEETFFLFISQSPPGRVHFVAPQRHPHTLLSLPLHPHRVPWLINVRRPGVDGERSADFCSVMQQFKQRFGSDITELCAGKYTVRHALEGPVAMLIQKPATAS
jgi:hypothetical protein